MLPAEKIRSIVRVRAHDSVWVAIGKAMLITQLERCSVNADLSACNCEVHRHAALLAKKGMILHDSNDVLYARAVELYDVVYILFARAHAPRHILTEWHERVCRGAVGAVGQHILIGAESRVSAAPDSAVCSCAKVR